MPIASASLETLEFPEIRARLARHCAFALSRELALALEPATEPVLVERAQALTAEARLLLEDDPDLSIGGSRDIRPAVQRAQRGGVVEASALLEIATTLAAGRTLKRRLERLPRERFALLPEYAATLPDLSLIETAISQAIDDEGAVRDSASPELARLRREIRIAFQRLQEKLQAMLSSSVAGALQEPIITVRNGRYVIPVKASHRREVRGLVHDSSGSGATLYIEPLATVELNNRWRELQSAEEDEVARILGELSELVGSKGESIVLGVETIGAFDLLLAKARYAIANNATRPEIIADWRAVQARGEPLLQLVRARHPLIDRRVVVPTDLHLGGAFRILLITGPNTGGKTVALKTTGLLALMAQAGMQIPADAPSRVPVFAQIFADIGDEQSIEQSLSTFSSHMTNIIRILRALEDPLGDEVYAADRYALLQEELPPALVLFDELGAGTDPVEGAALARAIIARLLELGALGVATTHYAELKAFAYNTPGVQNGSVEFNVETLAPTYKLSIGLPGRSNALAIAARLGLDPAIIEAARSSVTREDAQIEDLLAGIHRERDAAASDLQRADELRRDAERYRDRLADELRQLEARKEAEIEAAREALESELREVRGQLRRLRDEFQSVSLSRQWLAEAEQRLQAAGQVAKQRTDAVRPRGPSAAPAVAAPKPFRVGERVFVRSVGLEGEIVELDEDDGTALIQVGGFRMRADLRELRRPNEKTGEVPAAPAPQKRSDRPIATPPPTDVSMTFDMRGWRASEVADRLDRYLNDAFLAGLQQVRLVHGKGTGALRQVVRDLLQRHPLVQAFANGGRDGGDGVTVATLVES